VRCIVLGLHCNKTGSALHHPQGAARESWGQGRTHARPTRWCFPDPTPPGADRRALHMPQGHRPQGQSPKGRATSSKPGAPLCVQLFIYTPLQVKAEVRGVVWSLLVGETPWPWDGQGVTVIPFG